MKKELHTPNMYKNVNITLDQYGETVVALKNAITKYKEYVVFFTDKLNASSSTAEVKFSDSAIKDAKVGLKHCEDFLETLQTGKLITKHTL